MSQLHSVLSEVTTALRKLWTNGRGWILIAVSVGWALSIGVRFVFPIMVPFFQAAFQLNLTTAGMLLTLLWAAYAIGHLPGGILGDRVGEGKILALSTVISAGMIFVVATSVNVWMLFIGTVTFGLATALYGPTRLTIFTHIYPNQSGLAIGLSIAAGSLGNAVLPIGAAFVTAHLTWRFGVGMFVPLFIGAAIVIWSAVPGSASSESSTANELSMQTLRRIVQGATRKSIPTVVAVQLCLSFIIQGFTSFYPTYLILVKQTSPGVASTLFGLFMAVGIVLQPISGNLIDRFYIGHVLPGLLGPGVIALWLLPFSTGIVQLIGVTLLASSFTGCLVVTQTYITASLPEEIRGTGLGVLKATWILIGATSPLLIGTLGDYGMFDESFFILAAVGCIGLFFAIHRL